MSFSEVSLIGAPASKACNTTNTMSVITLATKFKKRDQDHLISTTLHASTERERDQYYIYI